MIQLIVSGRCGTSLRVYGNSPERPSHPWKTPRKAPSLIFLFITSHNFLRCGVEKYTLLYNYTLVHYFMLYLSRQVHIYIHPSTALLFQVLFVGRVKVSHLKVPPSFIDKALSAFKLREKN